MKKVLTIQDISCVGQCSLTVALPIISACGVETVILPSAVLSNHTGGFKGFTFRDLTEDFPSIKERWEEEDIRFDAIYTGYLGSKRQIELVKDFFRDMLSDGGVRIVDPAMADHGKLYKGFDMEYVKQMKTLCANADIILPNMTEAAMLTSEECVLHHHTDAYIDALLIKLGNLGARYVVLKGIKKRDDMISVIVYDAKEGNKDTYTTKQIDRTSHGTGDCFASVFTGCLMRGKSMVESAKIAADFIVESLLATSKEHWYGVSFEKALPSLIRCL